MKRTIVVCCIAIIAVLCLCACSVPAEKPTAGIWYCEELKISIDFGVYQSQNTRQCAELHYDDGSISGILCRFDYGNGIDLVSVDQKTSYLIGKFSYRNDTFTITENSSKKEYVFVKIVDSTGSEDTGNEMPKDGVWYCKELKISVDFGHYIPESSTQAAKYHNDDGSTTAILYYLDENGETEFFDRNNETQYVLGRFHFGDDSVTLVAHSDKTEYIFTRIDPST